MTSALRHIAFDLDGTLLDTRKQIVRSLIEALPEARRTPAAMESIENAAGTSPLAVLKEYGVNSLSRYWRAHARNAEHCSLCSGDMVTELGRMRSRGISLSVLTSLPHRAAAHLLETHRLDALFERADGAGSLDFRKPSPRALLAHLARMRVSPENAAYVGDDARDMKMADDAGVFAIGVAWSPAGPAALKRAGARAIISRCADLQPFFSAQVATR